MSEQQSQLAPYDARGSERAAAEREAERIFGTAEWDAPLRNAFRAGARFAVRVAGCPDEGRDQATLQRLAAQSLDEGPCLVCGLLGMSKVEGGYLCLPHFIELERSIRAETDAALGAVAASPDEDGGCVVCGGKHYLRGPAPKGGSAYEVTPCPACNAEGEKPRYTFADELREKPVAGPADEEHWPT